MMPGKPSHKGTIRDLGVAKAALRLLRMAKNNGSQASIHRAIKAFNAVTSASIDERLYWFKAIVGSTGSDSATQSFTRFSTISFHCFPCDLKQSETLSDHFYYL